MMKRALITGITGMAGSYLARHLLSLGYEVHGVVRRISTPNLSRIVDILDQLHLHDGDLTDLSSLLRIVMARSYQEVYNLAAQSFVGTSWDQPWLTAQVTAIGALNLLEALRLTKSDARIYQASSSEMFGKVQEIPQKESTPFYPRSPYGVAKVFAHQMAINYRESYGMFCSTGICFNHEGPGRGLEFVTRKISNTVAKIKKGKATELRLGNLDAKRDWGFVGDYVKAMHLILQHDTPLDVVIATGETHCVMEFVQLAFERAGLDYRQYLVVDPHFYRPAEVDLLLGDPTLASDVLGWTPSVTFNELVNMMVDDDLQLEA
jgi:GDPmannose 4,6-dehydratase